MLFLPRQPLDTVADLRGALANAIALELGTIPPYLTALFSIKPGANADAGTIVRSVVIEEMLHLSLACNMLNAIGGAPDIPAAVLRYPAPLPMGIGDTPGGPPFIVPLQKLCEESIETFMTIEEPEHPLEFPDSAALGATEYHTIGEFYAAIGAQMRELGDGIFTGDPARQVTGWIDRDFIHAVLNPDDALQAIDLIVEQGEGTPQSPGDETELAHYYRFEQIQRHESLNRDPAIPQGYEWGTPTIALAADGVWPMIENPPEVPLPGGSEVARSSDDFDRTYTLLIDELQRTFNGEPGMLGAAMAQMHAIRLQAASLVTLPVPGHDGTAGPRFLYGKR